MTLSGGAAPTWNGPRRLAIYGTVVLLPMLALALVLGRFVTSEADRGALDAGLQQAESVNATGIETQLDGHSLSEGLSMGERERLTEMTGKLLRSERVLVLRLRDREGRVVFDAANPTDPPGPVIEDDEIGEALSGEAVVVRTSVGSDVIDGGRGTGAQAVEVYLPIHAESGDTAEVVGVLEIYTPYAPAAAAREAHLRRMYTAIAGGTALVWLSLALILWSMTRRIHAQSEQNRHLALHDTLTGLPNRALFHDRLAHAVATAGRAGHDVTVAMIDLDRFKEVNDTLGHANGDRLLRSVGDRLVQTVRPGDTVARLGGDEFGLVLPAVSGGEAGRILRRLIAAIGEEIELEGVPVAAEACVGWAEWPSDSDDLDDLLRQADVALYAAKAAGGEAVQYDVGLPQVDPGRLSLISELRLALANDQLTLEYQPKADLSRSRLVGFEALVRWNHPTRGRISPDDFIPVAESTGLIAPLTRWVLSHALDQLVQWGPEAAELTMAVNISARNLREPDLTSWIVDQLLARGLATSQLVVEITETSFASDPERAAQHVAALFDAGIKVSLDDFGQGFTSLSQLAHLKVRELKIDRSFVSEMLGNAKSHAIVASVIELGHQLGLTVVAEGVEDNRSLRELQTLGCDSAQGFHLARPLAPAAAMDLLNAAPTRAAA